MSSATRPHERQLQAGKGGATLDARQRFADLDLGARRRISPTETGLQKGPEHRESLLEESDGGGQTSNELYVRGSTALENEGLVACGSGDLDKACSHDRGCVAHWAPRSRAREGAQFKSPL